MENQATKIETKNTDTAVLQKNIADQVLERINVAVEAGQLRLPENFHPGNALKSAFLILLETKDSNGKPVLESCSKESIAFALQKMIILGLNPIKKQCDFIAYGGKLSCSPEYTADEMLAKRYGMKSIAKQVVYKDDEFEDGVDEKGRAIVLKHKPCNLADRKKENIVGAYATVIMEGGDQWAEIMNMEQIRDSWNQGPTKGNSPAHKNFPGEMCKRTVSRRAVKPIIRSSDDAALLKSDFIDETDGGVDTKMEQQIAQNANKKVIDIAEDAEVVAETKTPEPATNEEPTGLTEEEKVEIAKEEAAQAEAKPGADLFGGKGRVVRQPGF